MLFRSMGCCKHCSKAIIGISNAIILIACIIVAVIVYKKSQDTDWIDLIKNNVPFIFLIVVAAFAIVGSIFGLFIMCCKNKCWKVTYLLIILIVIVLEVVAVVLAYLYPDKFYDQIQERWGQGDYKKTTDKIEVEFNCCGWETFDITNCPAKNATKTCNESIHDEINKNFDRLKIGVIVLVALEVILFICAIVVACSKEDEYKKGGIQNFD